MPGNANRRLVDALVRHQTFLVGHARQLSEKLQQTLDETTPEMRKHLLEQFADNQNDTPTARKLRAVEARLAGLRVPQWDEVREQLVDRLAELAAAEPTFLGSVVGRIRDAISGVFDTPVAKELRKFVEGVLVAGRTVAELFKAASAADLARILGATRLGYLAREAAGSLVRRVLGSRSNPSAALRAAATALDTVVSTAVHSVSSAALELASKKARVKGLFSDLEIWISVLDAVTTLGCRLLHLKVFEYDKGLRPGYHYHCRSSRVPLLPDEEPPTIPETFAAWAEQQSGKFKKWLKGMKTFDRKLVPKLSLDEVKQLDKEMME